MELPPDVANLLNDQRPLSELSAEELDHRFKTARQFSKAKKLPDETKAQLAEIAKAAREELMARETGGPDGAGATGAAGNRRNSQPAAEQPAVVEQPPAVEQPPVAEAQPPAAAPPADAKQSQQLDGNAAVPEAEAKAKVYLDDRNARRQAFR